MPTADLNSHLGLGRLLHGVGVPEEKLDYMAVAGAHGAGFGSVKAANVRRAGKCHVAPEPSRCFKGRKPESNEKDIKGAGQDNATRQVPRSSIQAVAKATEQRRPRTINGPAVGVARNVERRLAALGCGYEQGL